MLRRVALVPEAQPSVGASAAHLAQQDRLGRPIGDIVVADVAVQVKDARVVGRDRRLDVVMATRITDQGGRSA